MEDWMAAVLKVDFFKTNIYILKVMNSKLDPSGMNPSTEESRSCEINYYVNYLCNGLYTVFT